ncbi:hypothetical protein [Nocardia gipuzkoensis]
MNDHPGGFSSYLIGLVTAAAVVVSLILVTGYEWFIVALLPGIGAAGLISDLVWVALTASRRWVIAVSGSIFILTTMLLAVLVVGKLAHGAAWQWPVGVVSALVAGLLMRVAIARVVTTLWLQKHLLDYPSIIGQVDRARLDAHTSAATALATAERARKFSELRPPPFLVGHREMLIKIARFHVLVAAYLSDIEKALPLCETATALSRRATRGVLGRLYVPQYAVCLCFQADCLTEADRLDDALAVGSDGIAVMRKLHAAKPGRRTELLTKSLTSQADRLEKLGRSADAEQLRIEANNHSAAKK